MTVTIEQVMEAWGIDDLVIHIPRHDDGTTRVCVNSVTVDERSARLPHDEWMEYRTPTRYGSVIGIGATHAEALECALRNAGVEPPSQIGEAAEEQEPSHPEPPQHQRRSDGDSASRERSPRRSSAP